jgi:uncharacterized protein (TIGR02270 family)
LRKLARVDHRIDAHHDGCVIAGEFGLQLLGRQLEDPSPAKLFAVSVVALTMQHRDVFERCLAIVDSVLIGTGLVSALGWVTPARLAGVAKGLFNASSPQRRKLGLAACRLHGVSPGQSVMAAALTDSSTVVRREALRIVGQNASRDFAATVNGRLSDEDPMCVLWAAWSAVLLGNRGSALESLVDAGMTSGPQRGRALRLALQAMSVVAAHKLLQSLAPDTNDRRRLIEGTGIVGDPTYIPWLIGHMANDQDARAAGEAFSLITGADLALLDLERKPPENFESGPNDDPDDPNVDMDPDDGLPWPDPERIKAWWEKHSARFQPGTRYFMGAPVTRDHCIDVLKNGYQRQRILAAHYLCLLEPGTPLFNTSAPAWRQQKLLAQMG